ncbi:protein of unknown function [Paraburkholderia dioscoreae]|uniref:Uncharacterized protein n=1 Tax=Paraburkholderia dioscoreae TaxID=2604047 RepID=A0A5Q4Z288_9BURK|nr:protein of unknown function [Paraburkholderia dioscoreae]
MQILLFLAAWTLLAVVICVWHHRAVKQHCPVRRVRFTRARWDIGRIADRHPWIVWLTAIAIATAWLAHNGVCADAETQLSVRISRSA